MKICLVVAIAQNHVIGKDNKLPWHMPADLQHFKRVTLNKSVIMGRKTYQSIGRLLPKRTNIIITRNNNFHVDGAVMATGLQDAIDKATSDDEIMIIGGSGIFEQSMDIAQRIYLTIIHHNFEGDSYFPSWSVDEWQEVAREDHQADQDNPHPYSFITLDKLYI